MPLPAPKDPNMPVIVSFPRRWPALLLAVLMPFVALVLQGLLWDSIRPLAFVFFYPGMLLSSWVGGRLGGLVALPLSVGFVVWFFMPPTRSWQVADPMDVLRLFFFIGFSLVIIYYHHRFRLGTEQYRNVTENIDDVVWVLDAESLRLQYVSPSVFKQQGYRPEELMALPVGQALSPTLVERLQGSGSAEGEQVITEEVLRPCKDGSLLWTEIVVSQISNPRTGRRQWLGVCRNIADRKRAEDRLKASEQRMRQMLDHIPTAIACFTAGRDPRLLFLNRQFVRLFGYSLEDIPDVDAWVQRSFVAEPGLVERLPWKRGGEPAPTGSGIDEAIESDMRCRDGSVRAVLLSAAVINDMLLVSFADITERKEIELRLRHMAQHDALTRLPNRTLFDEHLHAALSLARREKTRFGLMFIDLDHFKEVNDSLGHRIGDLLLQEASERLQRSVRESDITARIGGDEFVVLLRNVQDGAAALMVAEKVGARLSQPFIIESHRCSISASIGVALYPDHGKEPIELTRNADTAMYRAKEGGRNRAVLFA